MKEILMVNLQISDLAKRLDSKDTNKRVIESLIKCGAFDEISENRASLMAGYENVLDSISMDRKKMYKVKYHYLMFWSQ